MAAALRSVCFYSKLLYRSSFIVRLQSKFGVKAGDKLPSVNLYLDSPTNTVNVHDLFRGKKGVLFSVLGAFTPGCTQNHIPEYIENYQKFKNEGYELVVCVAVNDPFVMSAWGRSLNAEGKILMLADTNAELTKALNMDMDTRGVMGTVRSKRYSMVINDSTVQWMNHEPDHTGLACLLCIKNMRAMKTAT